MHADRNFRIIHYRTQSGIRNLALYGKRMHREHHHLSRIGWLRAAVLGANDGILSTASLILGVASATHSHNAMLVSGVSGLIAGALSMGAGEYVSVSSQADAENADIEQEKRELAEDQKGELHELTHIYVRRGLSRDLAAQVAEQLSRKNALDAHVRDELGISKIMRARPLQAAIASAASFSTGAAIPILAALIGPMTFAIEIVYAISLIMLVILGAVGAYAGGAPMRPAVLRVAGWGAFAMAITAGIGTLFHVNV
jgi:vacuolar iron transporter family protein